MVPSEIVTKPTKQRTPSLLAETGEQAARVAQRALVLATLRATGWSATRAAEALGVRAPDVLRAVKVLGLEEEYQQARDAGLVPKTGPRPTSK